MIPQQGRSDGGMSVCIPPKSVQVEFYDKKKVKERIAVSGIPSHNYGTSLPYGITQCYLPPDTSERASPSPQPVSRYSCVFVNTCQRGHLFEYTPTNRGLTQVGNVPGLVDPQLGTHTRGAEGCTCVGLHTHRTNTMTKYFKQSVTLSCYSH